MFFQLTFIHISFSFASFHSIFHSDSGDDDSVLQIQDIRSFWLIQDMMINAAFFAIIFQSFSMLVRYNE
jgi:hypothetical protein